MKAEHFREVLYTIILTTKSNKQEIADYLYVSTVTLNIWLREGMNAKRAARVMKKLRVYVCNCLNEREIASAQ